METTQLLTVLQLASAIRLPATWLKREAEAGRIPSLKVGRRLMFNKDAVERVLLERAAETPALANDADGTEAAP
jgi:excisionase family DNA binding protein